MPESDVTLDPGKVLLPVFVLLFTTQFRNFRVLSGIRLFD